MSESIKHECGIAMVRLRHPLSYYIEKYKTPNYGINKLYLLMQKQHNRGQDGAGIATIKINQKVGKEYMHRFRSTKANPIEDIFKNVGKQVVQFTAEQPPGIPKYNWLKENVPFLGEVYLGHLRYGTYGRNSITYVHPMMRKNNWRSRNLVLAGNFNMTNVDELFERLVELGQHPMEKIDTVTVLEKIGHFLDEENEAIFAEFKNEGLSNQQITERIENHLNLKKVLKRSCKDFDGGYAMAGMTGYGASFVARDPAGIRPCFYYADDEVVVVPSEKAAIKTAFDIEYSKIKEIKPAHALIIEKDGTFKEHKFIKELPKKSCSFERIYFSRGSDPVIYQERKKLGRMLCPQVLEKIDYDLENTVFSYIPNTAETAFLGMMVGMEEYLIQKRKAVIEEGKIKGKALENILSFRPRTEKLVIKDAKLRTFITNDDDRDEFVAHIYDTTYEVINKHKDTIVVIDDSIVRGTTLEKSIISMLDRLEPKRIIVVSSAPQICYPDCYGIDMSKMNEFVAFRAMLRLLEKSGKNYLLEKVYKKCKRDTYSGLQMPENHVKKLFAPFSYEEVSAEIANIVKQPHINAEVEVIYQTVDNLHKACPGHLGDWYFTGNYPTAGGNRVVNRAFMNFIEGKMDRAY